MLICLTANPANSSVDQLERLAADGADVADRLVDTAFVNGAVVVATCNRFEAYLDVDDADSEPGAAEAASRALDVVADANGLPVSELREQVAALQGDEVVEHLFRVASGLDSVVVGEDEISGQVRRALTRARDRGTVSSDLERLFQHASRTARGVKTQTALGGAGRSLVRLALDLASSRVVAWSTTRVLIVGTGQYAATTVAALRQHGAADLRVFSPSGRAAHFSAKHDLRLEENLTEAIAAADMVITCTATAHAISAAMVTDVAARTASADHHFAHARLIIDLGMPRNVEPAVAGVTGFELLDLDTLRIHAPLEELNAVRDARELVDAAALEFAAGAAERSLTAGIVALRSHVFDLLEAEIERTRRRSGGRSTAHTEAALRHLVGVLLHTPSMRARELARNGEHQEFLNALDALFGIQADDIQAGGVQAGDIQADDRDTTAPPARLESA